MSIYFDAVRTVIGWGIQRARGTGRRDRQLVLSVRVGVCDSKRIVQPTTELIIRRKLRTISTSRVCLAVKVASWLQAHTRYAISQFL